MGDIPGWIGAILQTIVIMASVGAFILRLHLDLRLLIQSHQQATARIGNMEEEIKKVGQILIEMAKQDTRISNLETRFQELSNRVFSHVRDTTS